MTTVSTEMRLADVALVESLETSLVEASLEVERTLSIVCERSRRWDAREVDLEVLREEAVALVSSGQPAVVPARRRQCARLIAEWIYQGFDARRADPRGTRCEPEPEVAESVSRDGPSENAMSGLGSVLQGEGEGRSGRGAELVALCADEKPWQQLREALYAAQDMDTAAKCVRRILPALNSIQVETFLVATGYPYAAFASAGRMVLVRLGWLAPSEDLRQCRQSYRQIVSRLSHHHGLPMAGVAYLLGVFTGRWPTGAVRPWCTARPRCQVCPLKLHCRYFQEKGRQIKLGVPATSKGPSVKLWAPSEQPRERLLRGYELSDGELLAILLRTGTSEQNVVELGRTLLHAVGGLYQLLKLTPQQIKARLRERGIKGIGDTKLALVKAALELGKRAATEKNDVRTRKASAIAQSRDVFERYRPRFMAAVQEEFLVVLLDTKNRIQGEYVVSRGTLDASIVHPRDVFRYAVDESASGVIFVHNHPSGDPRPSVEDRRMTQRLVEAGHLLGIRVLDHVIVGANSYYSFADEGEIVRS